MALSQRSRVDTESINACDAAHHVDYWLSF
jgi:hypothetical protein